MCVLETLKNTKIWLRMLFSFCCACPDPGKSTLDLGKMNESSPPKKRLFPKVPSSKIVVTFDPLGVGRTNWGKLKLRSPKTTLVCLDYYQTRTLTSRQVANHVNRLIARSGIYIYIYIYRVEAHGGNAQLRI